MKKFLSIILWVYYSSVAYAYDFSAVCSTGQILYYNILDADSMYVSVVYPGSTFDSAYYGFTEPSGSLTIPAWVNYNGQNYTVTAISSGSFAKCTDLNGTIEMPSTVKFIGSYAFLNCENISMLQFNAESCTEAFAAFEGCFFDTIVIGEGVRFIPEAVFANSIGIVFVHLPESVEVVGARAFYNCPNLREVTFGESLRSIGDYAFSDCPALETISPLNASMIGISAFYGDVSLTEVILLDGVVHISSQAFFNCRSIRNLLIGENVNTIKSLALYRCDAIDTLYCFALEPPILDSLSLPENLENRTLIVPCKSVELYEQSFGWNLFENIIADEQMRLVVTSNDDSFGYVVSSDSLFCEGGVGIIEAFPDDTYLFQYWDDGNTENPRDVLVISDTIFMAVFIEDTTTTGIKEDHIDKISVIVNDKNIIVTTWTPYHIWFYDIYGRCIYKSGAETCYCSYSVMSAGVYVVGVGDDYKKKILIR